MMDGMEILFVSDKDSIWINSLAINSLMEVSMVQFDIQLGSI